MIVADIQPLSSSASVLEFDGVASEFPSWEAAVADARRQGATPNLLPFPAPSIEVLATAPALRVRA